MKTEHTVCTSRRIYADASTVLNRISVKIPLLDGGQYYKTPFFIPQHFVMPWMVGQHNRLWRYNP